VSDQRVDLKQLLLLIKDSKNIRANLCLDEGCVLNTDDPKPLVKVINYFINYLSPLSAQPLEISLDLSDKNMLLTMLAYSAEAAIPEPSPKIPEALIPYNARHELIHEPGRFVQIKINFSRE
jgi:hypothetical protein